MKLIPYRQIVSAVEGMCISANCDLNKDIEEALTACINSEHSQIGKNILSQLLENARIARDEQIPICQDTGMAIFFVEYGQDIQITADSTSGNPSCSPSITDAINEGVRNGYQKGFLRKSVVRDPLLRTNTGDNTPAIIHFNVVPGENLKISFMPKGFGSENMSALTMLAPSAGVEGVKAFILDTVKNAGPNPCPPIVIGVGIGGSMEKAAQLAKQALLRPIGLHNALQHIQTLEEELLAMINTLDIGPAGLGGKTTALCIHIETYPTHIAGLPVAVNISCHATRHREVIL